jgi:hypothetical protein
MLRPYFYVNVTDIDSLQDQTFYSACIGNFILLCLFAKTQRKIHFRSS